MPADYLYQCYEFEERIEAAFKTFLEAEISGISVLTARSNAALVAPLVVLALDHQGPVDNENGPLCTHNSVVKDYFFIGTLRLHVRTLRQSDATVSDQHRSLRSKIRASLYDSPRPSDGVNANLTLHFLKSIREASTDHQAEPEDGFDDSVMDWAITYSIRDAAWPA